ncbi:FAD-dependent oxidoreductase [Candidatus Daviesbacteria bacterium]|nr:FAD-dependent oxidoreductase [Candidatus Daviesbacteria bacterium]
MPIYNVKLVNKEEIAKNTMAFYFEKPAGFEFIAGQSGDFTLINPPQTDQEGNLRSFSLASAPYEKNLMIASRMRDTAFKRVLKQLPINSQVMLDAPRGKFVLPSSDVTPVVFLTGGIGITPVRSIIAQATKDKLPHKLILFYSNKTAQDAVFTSELEFFAKQNPHFIFIPVMTQVKPNNWQGESGHISKSMLQEYINNLTIPIYYLSGPPGMVASMRQILMDAKISEDNIKTEQFLGY